MTKPERHQGQNPDGIGGEVQARSRLKTKAIPAAGAIGGALAGIIPTIRYVEDKMGVQGFAFWIFISALLFVLATWSFRKHIAEFVQRIQWVGAFLLMGGLLGLTILLFVTLVRVDSIAKDLQRFADIRSTEYVGSFPTNIAAIAQLVDQANSKVHVCVDHAAYGALSDAAGHEKLIDSLVEKAQAGKEVHILCYATELAAEHTRQQFRDSFQNETAVEDFFKGPKVQGFLESHSDYRPPNNVNEFIKLVERKDEEVVLELTRAGAKVRTLKEPIPMFMWIVDEQQAGVSFYKTGSDSQEETWITTDAPMVKLLGNILAEQWASTQPAS